MNPLQHSCKHTNTVSSTCTANSLHAGLIKLGSKKAFVPRNLIPLLFDSLFNSRIWMSAIYGLTATSVWVFSHSILQPFYAGHNPSYLLDVALDELGGGHLLSRQTLFQLKFVWWGERLAPFCPAGTTMGERGQWVPASWPASPLGRRSLYMEAAKNSHTCKHTVTGNQTAAIKQPQTIHRPRH